MDSVLQTRNGRLRGDLRDGIYSFKGVRFAEPPFGANRLLPPQPAKPWDGIRDALTFGPKSPQVAYPPGIAEGIPELVGSGEDCLSLNIWTPDLAGKLPVMVWIPGGMFEFHATGATPFYDGSRFARDGVVCVTIGYRVGAEGFLYLDDEISNLGLLDQIAALKWVQENIAAFGGDASNVTIFGESAGAMSVATLLAMPLAKGLFGRAIVQSGNKPMLNSIETAARIGRRLAELLGVEPTRQALTSTTSDQVLQAQAKLREELLQRPNPELWGEVALSYLPWAPTIDGQSIPDAPVKCFTEGAASDIDLLVGSNMEETRLFFVVDGSIDKITEPAIAALAQAYGLASDGLSAYRKIYPGASAGELFSAIQTDWYWRLPAARMADTHASTDSSSTFMYEFAWRSPQFGGRLGAAHSVEIPFVFDTLGLGTEPLLGLNPPQSLATAMHKAWVAFASSGDCGWPKYEATHRRTMHFDTVSQVLENPLASTLALWGMHA